MASRAMPACGSSGERGLYSEEMKTTLLHFAASMLSGMAAVGSAQAATAADPQTLYMRATVDEVPIDCSVGFSGASGD